MALDELVRTLESDAAARIEELRERASAEAARLRRECRSDLRRRRVAAGRSRQADLRAAAGRAVEAARRDATRRLLQTRLTVLERIRRRVGERLRVRIDDPALLPGLQRDLREGLTFFGEDSVVVTGAASQLARLSAPGGGSHGVRFGPDDASGVGLVLRSSTGKVTVDATLESRLEQAWPRFAIELARRLECSP